MTNKKNPFWRFFFSLLPGAGEMYMGFMKMGVSTMTLFFLVFFAASSLGFGAFMVVDAVVWFYSFFRVHNMAGLPDEEFFALEDDYIFHLMNPASDGQEFVRKNRKIVAVALIFIGIAMTWNGLIQLLKDFLPQALYEYIWDLSFRLPRIIVGIAIICIGLLMIRGKKKELDGEEEWTGEEKQKGEKVRRDEEAEAQRDEETRRNEETQKNEETRRNEEARRNKETRRNEETQKNEEARRDEETRRNEETQKNEETQERGKFYGGRK